MTFWWHGACFQSCGEVRSFSCQAVPVRVVVKWLGIPKSEKTPYMSHAPGSPKCQNKKKETKHCLYSWCWDIEPICWALLEVQVVGGPRLV